MESKKFVNLGCPEMSYRRGCDQTANTILDGILRLRTRAEAIRYVRALTAVIGEMRYTSNNTTWFLGEAEERVSR